MSEPIRIYQVFFTEYEQGLKAVVAARSEEQARKLMGEGKWLRVDSIDLVGVATIETVGVLAREQL